MKNWLAKIGVFIFGIVIGIAATIGGIIGLGFWGYKNLSVNKIEQLTKQDLAFFRRILRAKFSLKRHVHRANNSKRCRDT